MLDPQRPALILAPMDGITDAPMRALMGETGAFTFAVSEFVRVSHEVLPKKVFRRDVPEVNHGCLTPTGLPVAVQILGGDPERMAASALNAVAVGATVLDINFGCPAPTVNRNDGGASLLRTPCRIRDVVRAVRDAVPAEIPVSAKMRLGWDSVDAIYENATMAAEGGATWLTIHARTRTQGYQPPVYWRPIGEVRAMLDIPVVANGDIWTLDEFRQCREMTGCQHFMIGRPALARPELAAEIARELGIGSPLCERRPWSEWFRALDRWTLHYEGSVPRHTLKRYKQWANLAAAQGNFPWFEALKRAATAEEFFAGLPD